LRKNRKPATRPLLGQSALDPLLHLALPGSAFAGSDVFLLHGIWSSFWTFQTQHLHVFDASHILDAFFTHSSYVLLAYYRMQGSSLAVNWCGGNSKYGQLLAPMFFSVCQRSSSRDGIFGLVFDSQHVFPRVSNMKWTTPEYVELLSEAYPRYQEADPDDREDIVRDVRGAIKRAARAKDIQLAPGLTKVQCTPIIKHFSSNMVARKSSTGSITTVPPRTRRPRPQSTAGSGLSGEW
jgi:hypothetical protein